MPENARTFEEAAAECAARITDEQKQFLRLHLNYIYHHFGYGMYLRGHYHYLIDTVPERMHSDDVGSKIYYLILPILFPEFKGYEEHLDRITQTPFDNLNACYFTKFGHNFIIDFPPEKYLTLSKPAIDSDEEFDKWWKQYLNENNRYALQIAERIWDIKTFSAKAHSLCLNDDDIKEIYDYCRNTLTEQSQFFPLELLFAKSTSPEAASSITECEEMLKLSFSNPSNSLEHLPQYVYSSRSMAKVMVSASGTSLHFLPDFTKDREIVITAIRDTLFACKYMDRSLLGDIEIAEEAAGNSKNGNIFSYEEFKQFNDNDRIVRIALEANGDNIRYASERIRSDHDMAVLALQNQRDGFAPNVFESLSEELRSSRELAIIELNSSGPSLSGFDDKLLDDDEIAEIFISNGKNLRQFGKMSRRIKEKYFDRLPEDVREDIKDEIYTDK